jgi:hypothetical protein
MAPIRLFQIRERRGRSKRFRPLWCGGSSAIGFRACPRGRALFLDSVSLTTQHREAYVTGSLVAGEFYYSLAILGETARVGPR